MLLVLLANLTGCFLLPSPNRPESLEKLHLAPPIGPARRIVQQITATWPNRQETLLCVLELDKGRIALAGMSAEGVSLFNLNYDGKKLVLDKSPLMPSGFSPEFIINDLQLVYWPLAEMQKTLPRSWRLETGNNYRRLFFNNEKLVDIDYLEPDPTWAKTVNLSNQRYRYRLHIKTISYELVPE